MSYLRGNVLGAKLAGWCRGLSAATRFANLALLGLLATGCATLEERDGAPSQEVQVNDIPDIKPQAEARSKYGNPESYVVHGRRYYTMKSSAGYAERGVASWYGTKFHGRRTSSGETYDMYKMTAAHKTLPLPSYVEVTDLSSRRTVVVRVNDRGPFHDNRIIDLSYAAAKKLGIAEKGTGLVEIRVLDGAGRATQAAVSELPPGQDAGSAVTNFYLQVGAFREPTNAALLSARVREISIDRVNITNELQRGNPLYRVRIGPLADINIADRIVQQLRRIGLTDHMIVLK